MPVGALARASNSGTLSLSTCIAGGGTLLDGQIEGLLSDAVELGEILADGMAPMFCFPRRIVGAILVK